MSLLFTCVSQNATYSSSYLLTPHLPILAHGLGAAQYIQDRQWGYSLQRQYGTLHRRHDQMPRRLQEMQWLVSVSSVWHMA